MSSGNPPAQKRTAVVTPSVGVPAPPTNEPTDRTKSLVNEFNGVVSKEETASAVSIKYKHSQPPSPANTNADAIQRLSVKLETDQAAAALVRDITYYGNISWPSSVGDTLMSHCANVVNIKSLTANADWHKVLAGKNRLKHLSLFTSGDYHQLKLPTLLSALKYCKELEEIRILGDSMPVHTVQESAAAYGANQGMVLSKVHTLTVTPQQAACNPADLAYLMNLCPNVKKLRIRIDSTQERCAPALDACFGGKWDKIVELELLTSAPDKAQIPVNLSKLIHLQLIQTHRLVIAPSSLPNVASLTSIEYDVGSSVDEVMPDLKNYLARATKADKLTLLSLVTARLEKKDIYSTEIKAIQGRQNLKVAWPLEGLARPGSNRKRSIYDRADMIF